MNVQIKKITLLAIMLIVTNVSALSTINYPDLSGAKSAIKERQQELYSRLQALTESDSSYKKAEVYGKLAQFYHVHDYLNVAIQLYDEAIKRASANSKWYYLKAMAYKNMGNFDGVKKALMLAIKYNNQYMPALVQLGDIYLQEGKLGESAKAYEEALKIKSNSTRALVGRGQVYMQQGQINSALEKYLQAIKIQPFATKINFLISQAYAANGDLKNAKIYNAKKGEVQVHMDDPLMANLFKESRSMSYYNDKAVRALMMRQYRQAELFAKTAEKYDPQSAYPQATLANIYVSTGRINQAKELLQNIHTENEQDANLFYTLGVIEEKIGNDNKAVYWYKKVLALDAENIRAHITLANAYMRLGFYDKALVLLQKAKIIDPENAYVLHRLAAIYAHKNQCSQATSTIYDAIKIKPKSFAFLLTLVKIAVHCQVSEQVMQDALNAARNMYQISQDTYLVEVLAMIEAKNHHYKEAIDYQAQAIYQIMLRDKKSEKLKQLKTNLELYKAYKYPHNLFRSDDVEMQPRSFNSVN